jgi:arylsulfatase A-like enzyme
MKAMVLAACSIGPASCVSVLPEERSLSGSRPNIIFILADDLSYRDLSFFGQSRFRTPNLDRMAGGGMVFTNAYAGSPECAPSRASLLTGMHMGHCRIRNNRSVRGQDHLMDGDQTIAEVLKNAGYATCFLGKWGIGLPGTEGVPHKQGFDYAYGFYDQLRAHGYYPDYMKENGRIELLPENHGFDMERVYRYNRRKVDHLEDVKNRYNPTGRLIPDGVKDPARARHSETLFIKKAVGFIQACNDRPFFLFYATQLPHGPCITPDLSRFMNRGWSLKHQEWAAMVTQMDRSVGSILDELDRQGIADNTLLLFASDNGYSQWGYFARPAWEDDPLFINKGPWDAGKFICRDGGVRVPFFAYWPGRIEAGRSPHICALYDVLETAADVAGITPEKATDGISLVSVLEGRGGQQTRHPYLYWENGSMGQHAQAVRMDQWFAFRSHPSKEIELFDMERDRACQDDVSSRHPEVVKEVLRIITEAHTDSEWYVNPGEPPEVTRAKKERAEKEGSLQTPTRANSRY